MSKTETISSKHSNKNLFTIGDIKNLSVNEVAGLYRKYINSAQANIYSKLSFGQDIFTRAEGMYMQTASGRNILDFTGGIGVLSHGHNNQRVLKVRKDFQNNHEMEVHKQVFSPYMAALSHNVSTLLPEPLNKCFFPNSGAEAVEGAIKLAYKYHRGKRSLILHSHISFHGNLIGSGSISSASGYKEQFPVLPGAIEFEYNNTASVSKQINEHRNKDGSSNIYALIVEPFHASSLTSCSEKHLVELRKLCTEENIILIFDEIYCGWGKTGELFNFMRVPDLLPDIVTMSKSFGGGKSSISCFVTADEVFDSAYGNANDALLHTSTYNGFGEECVTAIEAINIIIEEGYVDNASSIGEQLKTGLNKLEKHFHKDIVEVRGTGCLMGLILASPLQPIENILAKLPNQYLQQKGTLLKKAAALSLMDYLYEKHGILTHINKDPEWVVFMITPSIIAEPEDVQLFLDSLYEAFDYGLNKLVTRFLYKYVIN